MILREDTAADLAALEGASRAGAGPSATAIDAATVAAVDRQGMVDAVRAMPAQLRDGLRRARDAGPEPTDCPFGMVVCAMGGSAIGGDLAAAVIGESAKRPIRVVRDYQPGSGVGPDTLLLSASYSGDTEETLECFEAAGRTGAVRVALTTGGTLARLAASAGVATIELPAGLQPRAAVGYMLAGTLWCAERSGASPPLGDDLVRAASALEARAGAWGPDAPERALPKALARWLQGTIPVVYGAGLTAPVARRWKCQINENAKVPAFFSELPETSHNEICGWRRERSGPLSAIFLDDSGTHPRTRRRMELLAREAEAAGLPVATLASQTGTRSERLMSLVMLGDLLSVYIAVLEGVDPTPVDQIGRLKAELARTA